MARRKDARRRCEQEAPPARVRRRALALVAAAQQRLDVDDEALSEAAIHDLRVLCKRLRAVWQLLTPALGRDRTRSPERALRDAAQALAGHREAHVARRTIDRLSQRHALDEEERDALRALAGLVAERWPEVRAEPSLALPLRAVFLAQGEALRALPEGLSGDELAAGLLRGYARARRQGRRATRLREAEAWHRCRRWAKYELYQLQLLQPVGPEAERVGRLERLGEALGRFNDLCTLHALAEAGRFRLLRAGAAVSVARILAQEERGLRARMERRYGKLYDLPRAERAKHVRRRLLRPET